MFADSMLSFSAFICERAVIAIDHTLNVKFIESGTPSRTKPVQAWTKGKALLEGMHIWKEKAAKAHI